MTLQLPSKPSSYSDLEWEFLVHPGEYQWRQEWTELRKNRAYWQPRIEWICRKHNIEIDTPLSFELGTNPVYFIGDLAIKVFVRRNPIWFPREVESLDALKDKPDARVPELLGWGDAIDGNADHPYIIMRRTAGKPYWIYQGKIPAAEEFEIVRDVAKATRVLHEMDIATLKTFGNSNDEWIPRLRARTKHIVPTYQPNVRKELLDGIHDAIASRLHLVTSDFTPTFLHADINSGNVLVDLVDGVHRFSGIVDFGDAEVGPLEYEWISIFTKQFASSREKIKVFCDAYGIEYPFPTLLREKLKLYFMLHRFSVMIYMEMESDYKKARSMEEFLTMLWD